MSPNVRHLVNPGLDDTMTKPPPSPSNSGLRPAIAKATLPPMEYPTAKNGPPPTESHTAATASAARKTPPKPQGTYLNICEAFTSQETPGATEKSRTLQEDGEERRADRATRCPWITYCRKFLHPIIPLAPWPGSSTERMAYSAAEASFENSPTQSSCFQESGEGCIEW